MRSPLMQHLPPMDVSSALLSAGAENAGGGDSREHPVGKHYNTFARNFRTTISKLNAPKRIPLAIVQSPDTPLSYDDDDVYHPDDCDEAARVAHFHCYWRRKTIMAIVLASFAVLLSLATFVFGFPWDAAQLEERQVGAPPLNDFLNVSRPANMTEYDSDTWTLGTHVLVQNAYQVQPYIANGYHGSRLTAEGVGYWVCFLLVRRDWSVC